MPASYIDRASQLTAPAIFSLDIGFLGSLNPHSSRSLHCPVTKDTASFADYLAIPWKGRKGRVIARRADLRHSLRCRYRFTTEQL